MSELQKYYVNWGEWCSDRAILLSLGLPETEIVEAYGVADVDAARAADKARIELLQRAVEWCIANNAGHGYVDLREDGIYIGETMVLMDKAFDQSLEPPTEFAEIIKAVKP